MKSNLLCTDSNFESEEENLSEIEDKDKTEMRGSHSEKRKAPQTIKDKPDRDMTEKSLIQKKRTFQERLDKTNKIILIDGPSVDGSCIMAMN